MTQKKTIIAIPHDEQKFSNGSLGLDRNRTNCVLSFLIIPQCYVSIHSILNFYN